MMDTQFTKDRDESNIMSFYYRTKNDDKEFSKDNKCNRYNIIINLMLTSHLL